MARPANKSRGEVALPAFGATAVLRFTIDAHERAEAAYPDQEDYILFFVRELSRPDRKVVLALLECAIHGATKKEDGTLDLKPFDEGKISITEIADGLIDALLLSYHGRTLAEQTVWEQKKQEEALEAQRDALTKNPQLMAAFLNALSEQPTATTSTPEKSET